MRIMIGRSWPVEQRLFIPRQLGSLRVPGRRLIIRQGGGVVMGLGSTLVVGRQGRRLGHHTRGAPAQIDAAVVTADASVGALSVRIANIVALARRGIVAFLNKCELDIQQNKEPRNSKAMLKRMIFITKHLSVSLTKSLLE